MLQKNLMKLNYCFHNQSGLPNHALMAAYSYYSSNYYGDAIAELERFLKTYPKNKIFLMHIFF